MSIVLCKKKVTSQISLLIITIFWMSLFSPGIFVKIGNIKGQIIVILLWTISIMFSIFLPREALGSIQERN